MIILFLLKGGSTIDSTQLLHRIILIFILGAAARTDLIYRKISNHTIVAGVAAAAAAYLLEPLKPGKEELISGALLMAAACWLFHYHMLGAGDVKLAAFVLLAAPGDGTGILLAGLCLAALYGLARMMKKRMLMDRFLYLLMWAGSFAGSKTVYYDDLRDGPKAAVPLAFFILVSACAYTLAG